MLTFKERLARRITKMRTEFVRRFKVIIYDSTLEQEQVAIINEASREFPSSFCPLKEKAPASNLF